MLFSEVFYFNVCLCYNVIWCNNWLRNSKIFILFKCILSVQILLAVYNKSATFFNNKPIRSEGKRTPRADVYSHNVWIGCFCDLKNGVQLVPFTLQDNIRSSLFVRNPLNNTSYDARYKNNLVCVPWVGSCLSVQDRLNGSIWKGQTSSVLQVC